MANRNLILTTIKVFEEEHGSNSYLGRTKLQKICYFGIRTGIRYDLSYRMYHYGPYSVELENELINLQVEGMITDKSRKKERYSDYKLTSKGKRALGRKGNKVSGRDPRIRPMVSSLGQLPSQLLELWATIHFTSPSSDKRLKSKNRIIKEVKAIKGKKFTREQIEEAYNILKKAGIM